MFRPLGHVLFVLGAVHLVGCSCDGGIQAVNRSPSVWIESPLDGDLVLADEPVTFVAGADDRDQATASLQFEWVSSIDGPLSGQSEVEDKIVRFTPTGNLTLGEHRIAFTAIDERSAEDTVEIGVIVRANAAPAITFVEPVDGVVVLRGEAVTVEASVADDFTIVSELTLAWSGLPPGAPAPAAPDGAGQIWFDVEGLEWGEQNFTLRATDAHGLFSEAEVALRVAVDDDRDGFESGAFGGDDCNDADDNIHPGAPEFCNEIDDDCDNLIDEEGALGAPTWFRDFDADGHGDPANPVDACVRPANATENATDCDDSLGSVHPGATEYCNGHDDDCDGQSDESDAADGTTWYEDVDGDGFGNPLVSTTDCSLPVGFAANDDDCNDLAGSAHPGATEVCDTLDNDCDSVVDEGGPLWFFDGDGDGYGTAVSPTQACTQPTNHVANSDDCDDAILSVNPGAPEVCNEDDDDCNLLVDDNAVDATTFYTDADGDSFGDPTLPYVSCDGEGYADNGQDCDDTLFSVRPTASEYCNGRDDDCDGATDEGSAVDADPYWGDGDGDGYGDPTVTQNACAQPGGFVTNNDDCDDGRTDVYPGAPELCDTRDNDCDAAIDEDHLTFWLDDDGDGYGDLFSTTQACSAPTGYVANDDDCDDTAPGIRPGAPEFCNGFDEDCDYIPDNNAVNAPDWYPDEDNDGFGDQSAAVTSCESNGLLALGGDCDDDDTTIYPGAPELCDGVDNDCDPATEDEHAVPGEYASIGDAVDAAADGELVCVAEGTFFGAVDYAGKDVVVEGQGQGETILDASLGGVTWSGGETDAAVLRGLSIENATGTQGAALYIDGASPTIENVTVFNTTCAASAACEGAVLYLNDSEATFTDVIFESNQIAPVTYGVRGGVVLMTGGAPSFERVNFVYNTISTLGSYYCTPAAYGHCIDGGLIAMENADPTFTDVQITGTVVQTFFYVHPIFWWQTPVGHTVAGGLVYMDQSSPTFTRTEILDTSVDSIWITGGLFYSFDRSHPELHNVIIANTQIEGGSAWGNSHARGGIAYVTPGTGSGTAYATMLLDQVDIADVEITSDAVQGGALWVYGTDAVAPSTQNYTNCGITLNNTSIWGVAALARNGAAVPPPQGAVMHSPATVTTGHTRIEWDHSNSYANAGCIGTTVSCTPMDEFGTVASPIGVNGNVSVDPMYTDTGALLAEGWDLTLQPGSLLIDAGESAELDADGTLADVGAYGGPWGTGW